MQPRDSWLDRLERNIDLPAYLGQRGFEAQRVTSEGITMANVNTGDSVVVKASQERGGWLYEGLNNPQDRGTITDFIISRDRIGPEQAADRVIVLAESHSQDQEACRYRERLHGSGPVQNARSEYQRGLQEERGAKAVLEKVGIPQGTLDEWRFGGVKNLETVAKVMADPADLWASKYRPTDKQLVFTEQPIDAMAYENIRGRQVSCYMATGRQLTPEVRKKIAHVLCEIPRGVTVVLAFGRDERGQHLAEQVRALAPTLRMERQAPDFGSRWSTQLQLEHRHSRSLGRAALELGGR